MIKSTSGNLLNSPADALVNAVNSVGVMGKGIALQFKERFPEAFKAYAAACSAGQVRVGDMFVTPGGPAGPKWIIHFPTKQHWKNPSRLEWIRDGLVALRGLIQERQIKSIAIPPLGCGLGGLDWAEVRPMIEAALGDLPGVDVWLYEPVMGATISSGMKQGMSGEGGAR